MKELWKEHRHAYMVINWSLILFIAPAIHISNAETWVAQLIYATWILIGGFILAIALNVLIEMEVDKRLKEKD